MMPNKPGNKIRKKRFFDIDAYAMKLRSKSIIGNNRFLITNYEGSNQEKDISDGSNCYGFGRIHHFRYNKGDDWVPDPLPHRVAAWKLGLPVKDTERVQVFQIAACNCRCWYCYVDYELLSASKKRAEYKSTDDLLDLFLQEKDCPNIIDLSGGEPDIVPEWSVRMMESLIRRNLHDKYYLWLDDNLTSYFAWDYLKDSDFELMRNYKNFGRVGCFKGFSPESFHENTQTQPEILKRQIDIMSKWVNLGLDMYGYITLTTSNLVGMRNSLKEFMDAIQKNIHPSFLLRIIPLKIISFTPNKNKMTEWKQRSLVNQFEVLSVWKDELQDRYSKTERDCPIYLIKLDKLSS
jgi:uncharacterized Fe-S cluster-containing radical SAM superfamily protein